MKRDISNIYKNLVSNDTKTNIIENLSEKPVKEEKPQAKKGRKKKEEK